MLLAEDQHPVSDLRPRREHEPFRISVRPWAPGRDLHGLDTGTGQDGVERGSHSAPWVLDGAVVGDRSDPELALTPDLLEVAAASQTAISASALVLEKHARDFGFDPEPYTRKSRQRRMMLDTLMREQAIRQTTNPANLIQAQ